MGTVQYCDQFSAKIYYVIRLIGQSVCALSECISLVVLSHPVSPWAGWALGVSQGLPDVWGKSKEPLGLEQIRLGENISTLPSFSPAAPVLVFFL